MYKLPTLADFKFSFTDPANSNLPVWRKERFYLPSQTEYVTVWEVIYYHWTGKRL